MAVGGLGLVGESRGTTLGTAACILGGVGLVGEILILSLAAATGVLGFGLDRRSMLLWMSARLRRNPVSALFDLDFAD